MLNIGNLTASQFIQRNMSNQIKEITESTQRLSSGKRVNSASDDPSSIGPISRLNAQVLSLGKAISNGAEGKILTQTADSGLSSINNLLARVRELAVQGGSTTLTTADRNTLQVEIDAYLTEIDSLTKLINFNTIKLLDGSSDSVSFLVGENKDDNISINLVKSDSTALGLSGASGVKEFTSGRVTGFTYNSSNLAASDIKINSQNALAATLTDNLSSGNNTATALVTAINANSNNHGATATGFNKLTSAAKSSLSMSNTFTVNTNLISIQTSLANLVTEINQEAAGVTASLNSDNTITLSNTTGNDIVIGGNAPTDAGFTAGTYIGYLKLANVDGTFVKIEAMTKANGYASNSGNIDDLARFGFNEVDSSTVIRSDLVSTNALTASHNIKINDVDIGASDSASAAAKAIAINAVSSSTNVTASGNNLVTLDLNFGEASTASSNIAINGNAINFSSVSNATETITAINNASIGDIVASANSSGEVQLSSASGADIVITHGGSHGIFFDGHTDATGATISTASSVTFKGQILLTHTAGDVIKISGDDVGELGFQAQASSSASTPGSIISVSTSSNATSALTTIDTAIDTIANTRAKFGASENAIDHRLSYLLDAKVNSTSRLSKIEDADFALETARLTKAQIMSKAASSMLAQANANGEVFLRLIN
ncbi:MAG: flagellin [Candidatus Puniceispirillales bacterium]